MTRTELHAKIDGLLNDWEQGRAFGNVELEVREGKVILLRTIKTEKLEDRGNNAHAKNNYR
jgi:hypothetical protein